MEIRHRYDELCKKLLANKDALAQILKTCVEEYKDCNIYEIADKYIEGVPEISKEDVYDSYRNIEGLNTEDSSPNEGTIRFDILFKAKIPDSDEEVGLIINIEAQNKYHTGYPLVKRGMYYCSRLISSQYKRYFEKLHYENIRKVYSIWICMDVPAERKNTITRYRMSEQNIVGKVKEDRRSYDLLNVVMICLGDENSDNYYGLIKFLDIFINKIKDSTRRKILVEEFGFRVDEYFESEVAEMCNLSEGVLERGIKQETEKVLVNAFNMGMSMEIMQGLTNLDEDEIREILNARGCKP